MSENTRFDPDVLKDITLLHVDDDPLGAGYAEQIVQPHVKAYHSAGNGQEGLLAFARFDPDLVVTDIRMPKVDGVAMITAIREMRPDTPVIITTALDDPSVLRQCIRLGITSYVLKPFEPEELLRVLAGKAADVRKNKELEKQKRLNELLLNSLPHPAMLIERDARTILSANSYARRLGFCVSEGLHDEVFRRILETAESEDAPLSLFHSGANTDFRDVRAFDRAWDVNLELVTESIILFFATDVTERHEKDKALKKEKEFISTILENSYDGIGVTTKEGRIIFFSPGMERLFGYKAEELYSAPHWAEMVIPDESQRRKVLGLWGAFMHSGGRERIFPIVQKNGEHRWCRFHVSHMPNGDVVINGQDVTRIKQAEERIRYMAMHDPLTELPNRQLFRDRFARNLAHAKRYGNMVALLFIDLDRFKQVNDVYGHDIGDRVLCETGARLTNCVREPDTVSRIGGDEFMVILPEIIRIEDAAEVAGRILKTLNEPFQIDGESHEVGAAVGVSMFPSDGEEAEDLIKKADKAMYDVKHTKQSGLRFYRNLGDES